MEIGRYFCHQCLYKRWESGWHSGTVIAFEIMIGTGLIVRVIVHVYAQKYQYALAKVVAAMVLPLE
jgi:uncharacterized membrane protein